MANLKKLVIKPDLDSEGEEEGTAIEKGEEEKAKEEENEEEVCYWCCQKVEVD